MKHIHPPIDLEFILPLHPEVPAERAAAIAAALQHCSPRVSRSRLVATWRTGGMPPAELALAEALLLPPVAEIEPTDEPLAPDDLPDSDPELGDFSDLDDHD